MSQYQFSRLLRDIARDPDVARRCRTDLGSLLSSYDLNEGEKEAVKSWSVRALL